MNYKLSVLIATLHSRTERLKNLVTELNYQIQSKPVQILWIGDNKSISVGEKRNMLMNLAKGEWVAFVDDDDTIAANYIEVLLKAIDDNPEKKVICFYGRQTTDGHEDLPFRYSVNFGRNYKAEIDGKRWKVQLPDHLCCWRKSEIKESFPDKNMGEDHDWARKMAFTYKEDDQVLLTETLYHYNFSREVTETRRR